MSTPLTADQEIVLDIDSLSHGGSGVGRYQDFVVFTPFTCPGDRVRVKITTLKKNYAQAELLEIVMPSETRQSPPCSVFGQCGGCQWQHVTYQEQIRQKQLLVTHALSRIAKEENVEIAPVIPSPDPLFYRNRAQFRAEGAKVGFYQKSSHTLVEFERCLICEPSLNEELAKIKNERKATADFHTAKIEVFKTPDGEVARSLNRGHGEETGFSQVNSKQNLNLQNFVNQIVGNPDTVDSDNVGGRGNLLDLYCGNGNFSFPLNSLGWRIYGVDSSRHAIQRARTESNSNTFFSVADVSWEVKKLADKNRKFEVVVLDPPRAGADERLWQNLIKLAPQKVVYISCDPANFARDWARLKKKGPLKLKLIQPFDMFPQTFHVELVALATF